MWFDVLAATQWYWKGLRNYGHRGYVNHVMKGKDPHIQEHQDLSGRNYIVTGANSGIGYAIALELARRKALVHMVCRDSNRAEEAKEEMVKTLRTSKIEPSLKVYIADLSDKDSIRAFADTFSAKNDSLHGLINNAGALYQEERRIKDQLELSMAISLGGSYYLTKLMLPLLMKANGRVIDISSGGQYLVRLNVDDLKGLKNTGSNYNGMAAYAFAKRAQVELTRQWAQEKKESGVRFYSMHPGWAKTPGVTKSLEAFEKSHGRMMRSKEQGADTAIWLAIANKPLQHENGTFWFDREAVVSDFRFTSTASTDNDREKLWKACEELFP